MQKIRLRFKFSKLDKMKYIGHLDLAQIFQRAIKRAEIPIDYSKGMNPHQLFVICSPLTLGHESVGEIAEIELLQEVQPDDFIKKLNIMLPDGLFITECNILEDKDKSAASSLHSAVYDIHFGKNVLSTLNKEHIFLMTRTKSGEKEIDILPLIHKKSEKDGVLTITCATGNTNLKVDILVNYIKNELNISNNIKIVRKELIW